MIAARIAGNIDRLNLTNDNAVTASIIGADVNGDRLFTCTEGRLEIPTPSAPPTATSPSTDW